jgi:hypothetical protein
LRENDLFVSVAPNSHSSTELFAEDCGTEIGSSLTRHSVLTPNQIKELPATQSYAPWANSV